MSDQYVRKLFATLMGLSRPTYALYPATTGVPATGKTLTPGAGAWGAYADIIAAKAITEEFWLMAAMFDTSAGAHGLREVQIYNATTTTTVFEVRVDATAATVNIAPAKIPIPVWCAANAQIQGRAGAAAGDDTINVSLLVATGL